MIHRILRSKPYGHFGVSQNVDGEVLIQIGDGENQVRASFTNKEARLLVELIEDVLLEQDENMKDDYNYVKRSFINGICNSCLNNKKDCNCE